MYSIETYCNTHATFLTALERTVNKLLRILQCKRRREIHVVDLYINYNTLPLSGLFKLQILKFVHMFKFRKDKLPVVFYDYFISNSCIHNYSTRRKDEYHLNTINSYYGSRKLSSLGGILLLLNNKIIGILRTFCMFVNYVFGMNLEKLVKIITHCIIYKSF